MSHPWQTRPRFVDDPGTLFRTLLAEVAWTDQMRSRRTASMGVPYNYSGASYPVAHWHPAVAAVRDQVGATLGFDPTNCLLNLYPTGRSTLGWHADDTAILEPATPIAIVSLGVARPLALRRTLQVGDARRFEYTDVVLEPGSLLVMSQAMQADWRHAVKRHATTEPRISLTFRHIVRIVTESERRAAGGRAPPF